MNEITYDMKNGFPDKLSEILEKYNMDIIVAHNGGNSYKVTLTCEAAEQTGAKWEDWFIIKEANLSDLVTAINERHYDIDNVKYELENELRMTGQSSLGTLSELLQIDAENVLQTVNQFMADTEKTYPNLAEVQINKNVVTENPIHFGHLGNGITVYDTSRTDPETHDYPIVAHISAEGTLKVYDETLNQEDLKMITSCAERQRAEFMNEWDKKDTISKFFEIYEKSDITTMLNIDKDMNSMDKEQLIEKYMPYVILQEGQRPEVEEKEEIENDKTNYDD